MAIGTTAAILGAIGAASSIGQGVIGSKAAKGAAKTQADAAAEAARIAKEAGERAATDVTAAGDAAATDVTAAGERAAVGVDRAAGDAAAGVRDAGAAGQLGLRLSADEANSILRAIYGDQVASLGDFRTAGTEAIKTLAAATGAEGEFNKTPTMADLQMDPGFAFRLQEGQKAIERAAAARGGLQSGGTLKALTRYAQGVASDEYGKAFERFRTNRADRFKMISDVANMGQAAINKTVDAGSVYADRASGNIIRTGEGSADLGYKAASDAGGLILRGAETSGEMRLSSIGKAGDFRMGAADSSGRFRVNAAGQVVDAVTGGANAKAAGQIGSANAWGNTLSDLSQFGYMAALKAKNPAKNPKKLADLGDM